jgi:hypothetical protein
MGHRHGGIGEQVPELSETGSVVVDIGGAVGAAVVRTPGGLAGAEIEIRPAGAAWDGTHVTVIPRLVDRGVIYAALFPGLPEGRYEVRRRGGSEGGPTLTVEVRGGRVATVSWPEDHEH